MIRLAVGAGHWPERGAVAEGERSAQARIRQGLERAAKAGRRLEQTSPERLAGPRIGGGSRPSRGGNLAGGVLPSGHVVALLGSALEQRHGGEFPGADEEQDGVTVDQGDAGAGGLGVGHLEPTPAPAKLDGIHFFDPEPVGLREGAKIEFRAELIEPVAGLVVGGGDAQEMPPGLDQLEAVPQGIREMEHVFECSGVAHGIEPAVEFTRHRLVQVVHEARTLVARGVHRVVALRAQSFPERLGIRGVGRRE